MVSISECLNKIDNKIFDKSSKFLVKGDLENIRDHIEWKQADVVCSGKDDDKEKMLVLSMLYQINNIIEKFFSTDFNDTEEEFDGLYNDLRRKFLEWYDLIEVSLKWMETVTLQSFMITQT